MTRAPLARALAAQVVAGIAVFGAAKALGAIGISVPLAVLLVGQGLLAAWVGHRFGLARWWLPVQAMLPPGLAAGLWLPLPAWVYLAVFVLLLLLYWNSARGQVPLYLTNRRTTAALVALLPRRDGVRFLDLGGGFAGPAIRLARRRPDGRFAGVESAPLVFAVAWLRVRLFGPANATILFGDFWKIDLGGNDVVYAFLSPVPMAALHEKARAEMAPGSILVSNTFPVPGHAADETIVVGDRRRTRLHVYRF